MDKLSVHQSKPSSKQAKTAKKKPIKVVYISNPMKVKTSASDFRALVQELTGQDSNLADASRYLETSNDCHGVEEEEDVRRSRLVPKEGTHHRRQEVTRVDDPYGEAIRSLDSTFEHFEPFDQVFSPYMVENFSGYSNSSSGLLYDVAPRFEKPS